MRTIDSAMQTVINGKTKRPAITVTCEDHIQHYQLYQSPGTADGWNDAAIATDNSIIRCRIDRTSGTSNFTRTLYVQRITDPSIASQWSTWTTLSSINIFQDGSCAVSNNSGTLRVFAQNGSTSALQVWTSTDNGNSWTGPTTVLTPPGSALIRGIGSSGNNEVFIIYDVSGGDALGYSSWNGVSWSALITWTLTNIQSGAGIDVVWTALNTQYTLLYSDGYDLFSCIYNPSNNTWFTDTNIAPSTSTAIARTSPRVSFADGLYTLTVIESDSGLLTGSVYSYPRMRQSADLIHWSNGRILHEVSGNVTWGAVAFKLPTPQTGNAGSRYYIATMQSVYSAKAFTSAASQFLDVSAHVLSYKRVERQEKPAHIEMVIDNTNGLYNTLVSTSSGNTQPIGPNTSIVVNEGYYTGTPPTTKDVILTSVYHVNQLHIERTAEENQIKLVGLDKSRLLDYQSRYQQTYNNKQIWWLITEVLARAGLFSPSVAITTNTSQGVPQFVIHAGRAYRAALDELCTVYGLYYFMDQNEVIQVREKSTSGDTPVWSYQPEIELISFVTSDLRANHIVVSGIPPATGQAGALTTGEAYDDAHAEWVGVEQLLHVIDTKITTTTQCGYRATTQMAEEVRTASAHVVTVPVNPALQILDVITLTDYNAPTGSGQSGNARIIEQTITFNAQHADYTQQIALEGQ